MKNKLKIPPVSPLIGADFSTFFRVLSNGKVKPGRWFHVILSSLIILIFSPFRLIDFFWFRQQQRKKRISAQPVFILGHWRSGTTFLHNLLCQLEKVSFVTTYQSVFPHHLKSKAVIGRFMKTAMPSRRPGDNIKMDIDYPQEDEYALSNSTFASFYHFFYYPKKYRAFYQKYVRFENSSPAFKKYWAKKYHTVVMKAILNTGNAAIILKNPVNTARIPTLLQMYPQAKFIHIVRNPVTVYCSTKKFFSAVIPTLSFQKITPGEISQLIFWLYESIMHDFFNEKQQIPEKQFYEIRYETLLEKPDEVLEKLIHTLKIPFSEKDKLQISRYLKSQRTHKTDKYTLRRKEWDYLQKHWGFAMKQWNYSIPENVQIVD
ncbi:sulfotransferase [Candidatus Sulfidibacterium hydrothermale]|uniref:sulfotransferase family protein n=1 Tax=Candidatus Sulfidibacterium hydrothermale TaxID=2875962 RepID=UPI001F0AFC87|nr:sulfotransferase [Candidatus Sulfidibacterium hydrothermale]UBM62529.1 sulfotransferase [Candidatus Sulfidibacterium hydrothermale]